jgi:hypothetical protein
MFSPTQFPQNQCFSVHQQQHPIQQQQQVMQQQQTQQQPTMPYPQASLQLQVMPQQPTMPQQVMQQSQPYQYQQTYRNISPQQSSHEQPPFITSQRTNQHGDKNWNKQNPSTSDPVDDPQITTKYTWQTIKKKRKRTHLIPEEATEDQFQFNTQNRFAELSDPEDDDMKTNDTNKPTTNNKQPREQKPPPIYIYGVTNYGEMIKYISEVVEEEQYYCKALPNETIKITTNTADTYRKLIRKIQEDKIMHHTYQIREERAYRIVLRNPHHTIPTDQIKELQNQGHTVRNILNIQHRQTKEALPLFFVDLEPKGNNKNIYDIEFLCNSRIRVEAARKKNTIVQCTRSRCYGHTKTYCMKPYACVKRGEEHSSTICKKKKAQIPHQKVHSVEVTIRPITKDVTYI